MQLFIALKHRMAMNTNYFKTLEITEYSVPVIQNSTNDYYMHVCTCLLLLKIILNVFITN